MSDCKKNKKHGTWLNISARLSFYRPCHASLSSRCSAGACASPEHLTSEPQHGGQGDSVNISLTRYSRFKNKELRAASTCGGICGGTAAPLLGLGGGGEPPLPAPHLCTSASPPASQGPLRFLSAVACVGSFIECGDNVIAVAKPYVVAPADTNGETDKDREIDRDR